MARPLRVEYPGAHYHVINRGNAGGNIFETKKDREKFLNYLGKAVERFSLTIHTYCLMTNHYHLLVETPKANLSAAMQWLNVSYAVYYNRRHQRRGHLFEGRFKALLILDNLESSEDFAEAASYLAGLSPPATALLTSRRHIPAKLGTNVSLLELEPEDGTALFKRIGKRQSRRAETREDEEIIITTLGDIGKSADAIDMHTTVIIGGSESRIWRMGDNVKGIITPRGYHRKYVY